MREKDFIKTRIFEMVNAIDDLGYLTKIYSYVSAKLENSKEKKPV